MADFPALPLWTDAYLADTRHLTTEQHGAYLLLLMEAWRRKDCALPNDNRLLARLVGVSTQKWVRMSNTVMAFWELRDGYFFQNRLKKERAFCEQRSQKQRDRANTRWLKTNNSVDAVAVPKAMPDRCRSDAPTPTPLTIPIEESVTPHTPPLGGSVDAKPKRSSKRGSRLPEGWVPSEQNIQDAIKAGIPRHSVGDLGEQFRDYWIAVPGQRGTKLDWDATWRNRCKDQAPRFSDVKHRPKRGQLLDKLNQLDGEKGVMADAKRILQRAAAARDCRDHPPVGGNGQTERAEGEPGGCAVAVLPDGREVPIHGAATDGEPMDRGEAMVSVGGEGLRGRAKGSARPCDADDHKAERPMAGDQEQLDPDVGEALGAVVRATAWRS